MWGLAEPTWGLIQTVDCPGPLIWLVGPKPALEEQLDFTMETLEQINEPVKRWVLLLHATSRGQITYWILPMTWHESVQQQNKHGKLAEFSHFFPMIFSTYHPAS